MTAFQSTSRMNIHTMPYQYINLRYFDDNFCGEQQFIQEILSIFMEDVPKRMKELQHRIASKEWAEAAQTVHSIKASINMLGIEDFLEVIETFEQRVLVPNNEQEIQLLYNHAEHIMHQANTEIADYLSRP